MTNRNATTRAEIFYSSWFFVRIMPTSFSHSEFVFPFSFSIQIVFLLKKRKKQPLFSFQTSSHSSKASQNNHFFWERTENRERRVMKMLHLFFVLWTIFFKSLLFLINKVAVEVLDDPSLIFWKCRWWLRIQFMTNITWTDTRRGWAI